MYFALWIALYCCHVTYLSAFKFDYGYNMAASVGAGISLSIYYIHISYSHSVCTLLILPAGTLYSLVWVIWCLKVLCCHC